MEKHTYEMKFKGYTYLGEDESLKVINRILDDKVDSLSADPHEVIGFIVMESSNGETIDFPVVLRFITVGDDTYPQYEIAGAYSNDENSEPIDDRFDQIQEPNADHIITATVTAIPGNERDKYFLDYEYGYVTTDHDLKNDNTLISYLRIRNQNTKELYQIL